MKRKKLAQSLSLRMAILIVLCICALCTFSVFFASKTARKGIDGEFSAIGERNAADIQIILSEAENAGESASIQLERMIGEMKTGGEPNVASVLPGLKVTEELSYIEKYIKSVSSQTVVGSGCIIGMGAFFEPYTFDDTVKQYALYMDENTSVSGIAEAYPEDYTAEPYYSGAVSEGTTYITDPFDYYGTNMITSAQPIFCNGKVIGAICVDMSLDSFSSIQVQNENYPSMSAAIISDSGMIVFDSASSDMIGQSFSVLFADASEYAEIESHVADGVSFSAKSRLVDGQTVRSYFSPISYAGKTWWAQTSLSTADMNKSVQQMVYILMGISIVVVLIIIYFLFSSLKKGLAPLENISAAAKKMEAGCFDLQLDVRENNEIGELAEIFKGMSQRVTFIIKDIGQILARMTKGDFSAKSSDESAYVGEYKQLVVSIDFIGHELGDVISKIDASSQFISSNAEQIANGSQTLAQGTSEQAASVEELSATISSVSVQVGDTAKNAEETSELTQRVEATMQESLADMQMLHSSMEEITQASNNIGKVIKDIDDIAFQTNILALNAAVEAARAGSAGKGFAVVADEVRNLAQKSSESAKNSASLLETSVEAVSRGRKIAVDAETSFKDVSENASRIADLVGVITQAAVEQASELEQISIGVEQISSVIQMNATTAEESAASAQELSAQANALDAIVKQLRI